MILYTPKPEISGFGVILISAKGQTHHIFKARLSLAARQASFKASV
jgi:hypothetical protein